ncbi:phage tail protein [Massilia consociata]|uniref:Phage tail protein n=1 Tax=Massilia consociata TaxID=760117 RepID=A0ABV6FFC3_9BURK
MSDFFLGEIRLFPYDRIPSGWLPCKGQALQIRQNAALFSLLGTNYGGDGVNTFNLPDLRGQVPMCAGPNNSLGAAGGEEAHTLTVDEMPQHTHQVTASTGEASTPSPVDNTWAVVANAYAPAANVQMAPDALTVAGGGKAHNNMQPYLTLNLCIATVGIFPPRQ